MDTQEEIRQLKKRIADLEKLAEEERNFPQRNDEYWYIDNDGNILKEVWDDLDFENYRLSIGNVFRTKDQAKFAVEKLKVEAELRKFSDPWNLEETQYTFSFNWKVGEFEIDYLDCNQPLDSYYFDSDESLKQALETVGAERIKKYIFEVEG